MPPAVTILTLDAALNGCSAGVVQDGVAIDSKRGRVFLDRAGVVATVALDALPDPDAPVAVAGDAAIAVASRLAAKGFNVKLLAARLPEAAGIAAAERLDALPLYVDPPAARPGPAGRPAPV